MTTPKTFILVIGSVANDGMNKLFFLENDIVVCVYVYIFFVFFDFIKNT